MKPGLDAVIQLNWAGGLSNALLRYQMKGSPLCLNQLTAKLRHVGYAYDIYGELLKLQIKVGYWLTDLPHAKRGNFVCMPGSHRSQYFEGYAKHTSMPGEKILCCPKGTMTIMHCGLWHRVEPNESDAVRKNIFIAYCPSWLCEADRLECDPDWLKTLNREQRIIMRSYTHGYVRSKPPKEDFPLFLDRDTGQASDPGYSDDVPPNWRKRKVVVEEWGY